MIRTKKRSEPGAIATGSNDNAVNILASPKGTKIIAQGKAEGRHPGNASQNDTDPVRVEQTDVEAKNPVAIAPGSDTADLTKTPTPISLASPKGTKIIAQGKAEGRNPGITTQSDTDPEGVEQTNAAVAPLQGAEDIADRDPGFHPGLLSRVTYGDENAAVGRSQISVPRSGGLTACGLPQPRSQLSVLNSQFRGGSLLPLVLRLRRGRGFLRRRAIWL